MLLDAEGKLPTVNACLGPAETYANGCTHFGQTGTVQTDINDALKAAGASSAILPVNKLVYAAEYFGYKGVMLYTLPKEGLDCGVQNVMSRVSEVYGFYGAKNSGSGGGTTYCYIGTRTYK